MKRSASDIQAIVSAHPPAGGWRGAIWKVAERLHALKADEQQMQQAAAVWIDAHQPPGVEPIDVRHVLRDALSRLAGGECAHFFDEAVRRARLTDQQWLDGVLGVDDPFAEQLRDSHASRLLMFVCRELQDMRGQGQDFAISGEQAASIAGWLGSDGKPCRRTGRRKLRQLEAMGFMSQRSTGCNASRRANTYRLSPTALLTYRPTYQSVGQ